MSARLSRLSFLAMGGAFSGFLVAFLYLLLSQEPIWYYAGITGIQFAMTIAFLSFIFVVYVGLLREFMPLKGEGVGGSHQGKFFNVSEEFGGKFLQGFLLGAIFTGLMAWIPKEVTLYLMRGGIAFAASTLTLVVASVLIPTVILVFKDDLVRILRPSAGLQVDLGSSTPTIPKDHSFKSSASERYELVKSLVEDKLIDEKLAFYLIGADSGKWRKISEMIRAVSKIKETEVSNDIKKILLGRLSEEIRRLSEEERVKG